MGLFDGHVFPGLSSLGKWLWVAPFPRQGDLNCLSEETEVITSKQVGTHPLLSAPDPGYDVNFRFSAPTTLTSLL